MRRRELGCEVTHGQQLVSPPTRIYSRNVVARISAPVGPPAALISRENGLGERCDERQSPVSRWLPYLGHPGRPGLLGSPRTCSDRRHTLWVTNGPVSVVVRDGSTIYIGGAFTLVGPATG